MVRPRISELALCILLLSLTSPVSAVVFNHTGISGIDAPPTIPSVPFTIKLFAPSQNMIHSDQIMDMISEPGGGVIFATSYGLSFYNGTWETWHLNRNNISAGLMDDFITAVERDNKGNLWIGYSGGIQIYNGVYYQVIADQQLLKDTRINDLQRWNNDMWVATGTAGIHRYRNGTWTWFQPDTVNGPGFYYVNSMALDTSSNYNYMMIATDGNGLWVLKSPDDPVHFDLLASPYSTFGLLQQVRQDPEGGVYFFNDSAVVHYSPEHGFTPILSVHDLTNANIDINDIAADRYGKLYLATDNGIYIWENGAAERNINGADGIGPSPVVHTINIDAENRVWFSTQGYVGYLSAETPGQKNMIPIVLETPTPSPAPVAENTRIVVTPTIQLPASPLPAESLSSIPATAILSPVTDPLLQAIKAVLSVLGIKI